MAADFFLQKETTLRRKCVDKKVSLGKVQVVTGWQKPGQQKKYLKFSALKKEEIKYPFVLAFNDLLYTLRINSREGRRTEKRGGGAKRIRTPQQGVWSSTSGNSYRTSKNRYDLQ